MCEKFPWNDWNNVKNYAILHYKRPIVDSRALKAGWAWNTSTIYNAMKKKAKTTQMTENKNVSMIIVQTTFQVNVGLEVLNSCSPWISNGGHFLYPVYSIVEHIRHYIPLNNAPSYLLACVAVRI